MSNDVAVAILERVIQSIERVKADCRGPGNWEQRLVRLNQLVAELWKGRGHFLGWGSFLRYLGFEKGTPYQ